MKPSDLTGPLAQFQATEATKEDTLRMMNTLNEGLGQASLSEKKLAEAFELWWGKLESNLASISSPAPAKGLSRTQVELIEEILTISRGQARAVQDIADLVNQMRFDQVAGATYPYGPMPIFPGFTDSSPSVQSPRGPGLIITTDQLRRGFAPPVSVANDAFNSVAAGRALEENGAPKNS